MTALTPFEAAARARKGWVTRRARGHVKPKKLTAKELQQLNEHYGGEPVMRPLKDTPVVGPADPRDPSRRIINYRGHLFWRYHRIADDTGPLEEQRLIPITRNAETRQPRNFTRAKVKKEEGLKGSVRLLTSQEEIDLHNASLSPEEFEVGMKERVKEDYGGLPGTAEANLNAAKHRHALQHFYYNGLKEGRKLQDIDDEVMVDDIYDHYPVVFERVHKHVKAPINLKEIHVGNIPAYVEKHGATGIDSVDRGLEGVEDAAFSEVGGLYHPKNQTIVMPRSGPELEHAQVMANVKSGVPGTLGEHGSLTHELGHAHDPYLHIEQVRKHTLPGFRVEDYIDNKQHPRGYSNVANQHAGHFQYQHNNEAEDFAEQFRHHLGFFGEGGGKLGKRFSKEGKALAEQREIQKLALAEMQHDNRAISFIRNNPPQTNPKHIYNMPATGHKQTLLGYEGHDRSFHTYVTRSEDRDRHMLEEVFHIPQ